MAIPASRTDLKNYCLRRLGFPVVEINLDDDQIDDRIDDALEKYRDFHYDGTDTTPLAVQVSAGDIANGYIRMSDNIVGITRVLPTSYGVISTTSRGGFNIFDINYQIRLNDFYNLVSSSYTYYVIAKEHLAMLDMIITGEYPFTYNKSSNICHIQFDWKGVLEPNQFLVFEAVRIVDPNTYTKVFNDLWLKEYATQLLKRQWGENLKKYGGYTLPGGITVNGQGIYDEAIAAIGALEADLRDTYEMPPMMQVG